MISYSAPTEVFQNELISGETLLWTGQPSRKVIFHKEDIFVIPFSLMWGGFSIFWEILAAGSITHSKSDNFMVWLFPLWGIPFVVIGQYMIWGRFVHAYWKKARVFYGVTQRRVIIFDRSRARTVNASFINTMPVIEKRIRSDGIGTLRFGYAPESSYRTGRYGERSRGRSLDLFQTTGVPTFWDIENAEEVYRMVSELKSKTLEEGGHSVFSH